MNFDHRFNSRNALSAIPTGKLSCLCSEWSSKTKTKTRTEKWIKRQL